MPRRKNKPLGTSRNRGKGKGMLDPVMGMAGTSHGSGGMLGGLASRGGKGSRGRRGRRR